MTARRNALKTTYAITPIYPVVGYTVNNFISGNNYTFSTRGIDACVRGSDETRIIWTRRVINVYDRFDVFFAFSVLVLCVKILIFYYCVRTGATAFNSTTKDPCKNSPEDTSLAFLHRRPMCYSQE